MLLNILQYTGDPLTTKNDLSENVNSANVDKPCSACRDQKVRDYLGST